MKNTTPMSSFLDGKQTFFFVPSYIFKKFGDMASIYGGGGCDSLDVLNNFFIENDQVALKHNI